MLTSITDLDRLEASGTLHIQQVSKIYSDIVDVPLEVGVGQNHSYWRTLVGENIKYVLYIKCVSS